MFKRNISYILMFIIVLFGFNMEVRALECLYNITGSVLDKNTKSQSYAIKIGQDTNGKASFYMSGINVWDFGASLVNDNAYEDMDTYMKNILGESGNAYKCLINGSDCINTSNLTSCPKSFGVDKVSNGDGGLFGLGQTYTFELKFYNDDSGSFSLDENGFANDMPVLTCGYSNGYSFVQTETGGHAFYHKISGKDTYEKVSSYNINSSSANYVNNSYFSKCPTRLNDVSGSPLNFYFTDVDGGGNLEVNESKILDFPLESVAVDTSEQIINVIELDSCNDIDLTSKWLISTKDWKYSNSCLYSYNNDQAIKGKRCNLIQINYNDKEIEVSSSLSQHFSPLQIESFEVADIKSMYGDSENLSCPINLYSSTNPSQIYGTNEYKSVISLSTYEGAQKFSLARYTGSLDRPYQSLIDVDQPLVVDTCEDLLSDEIVGYLRFAYNALRIAVPIILLVIGIVDFARGVFSAEDEMKKIQQKFIKRLIIAVAFFLVPTLLKVLLDIAGNVFGIDTTFCGIFD